MGSSARVCPVAWLIIFLFYTQPAAATADYKPASSIGRRGSDGLPRSGKDHLESSCFDADSTPPGYVIVIVEAA